MDQERQKFYFPKVFHGKKTVSNESAQITGLANIGWMHIVSDTDSLYIGASGVSDDGLPLGNGDTFPVTASSLDKWYVSGNGSVSFAGGYTK